MSSVPRAGRGLGVRAGRSPRRLESETSDVTHTRSASETSRAVNDSSSTGGRSGHGSTSAIGYGSSGNHSSTVARPTALASISKRPPGNGPTVATMRAIVATRGALIAAAHLVAVLDQRSADCARAGLVGEAVEHEPAISGLEHVQRERLSGNATVASGNIARRPIRSLYRGPRSAADGPDG